LKLMPRRWKNRQTESIPAFLLALTEQMTLDRLQCPAGLLPTNSSNDSSCFFNGDRL